VLINSSSRNGAEKKQLQDEINALNVTFQSLERSEMNTQTVKAILKETFQLTCDGYMLSHRLEQIGLRPKALLGREIREVNKVANYWRVCISLADLSRGYRNLFSNIDFQRVERLPILSQQRGGIVRHVHAEVQLIVYYETSGSRNWPRVIGASKEACFLCHSFIKAHGHFSVSKAHRQVYSLWTVPDLANYKAESIKRLQGALATVSQDIATALDQHKRHRSHCSVPPQSSINLLKPSLPALSLTTIQSSAPSEADIQLDMTSSLQENLLGSPMVEISTVDGLNKSQNSFESISTITARSCAADNKSANMSIQGEALLYSSISSSKSPLGVRRGVLSANPNRADHIPVGWLDLHVYLEDHQHNQTPTMIFPTASITVQPLQTVLRLVGTWSLPAS
jgi:hypothetical protein